MSSEKEIFDFNYEKGIIDLTNLKYDQFYSPIWSNILSLNNIINFSYRSPYDKDFEQNLPKMIENNKGLMILDLSHNSRRLEFNIKNLKNALENHQKD